MITKNKTIKSILYMSTALLIIICGLVYVNTSEGEIDELIINDSTQQQHLNIDINKENKPTEDMVEEESIYTIHIAGEVNNPGVYHMNSKLCVNDAIDIAGGATKEANIHAINLARLVRDREQIIVPKKGEEIKVENNNDGLININLAGKIELTKLRGIGESRAEKIIKYRQDNDGFCSIEEIMNISGIDKKIYEDIKNMITVN